MVKFMMDNCDIEFEQHNTFHDLNCWGFYTELALAAAKYGSLDILKFFILNHHHDISISAYGNMALRTAVENGHFSVVAYLLYIKDIQESLSLEERNSLRGIALVKGHMDIYKCLGTSQTTDIRTEYLYSAIRMAVERNDSNLFEKLVDNSYLNKNKAWTQEILEFAITSKSNQVIMRIVKMIHGGNLPNIGLDSQTVARIYEIASTHWKNKELVDYDSIKRFIADGMK